MEGGRDALAGNGVECCLTLYLFCGGRARCLGWEWRGVLPDFVSILWREGEMPWLGMAWSVA